jgi:hypothetical protein
MSIKKSKFKVTLFCIFFSQAEKKAFSFYFPCFVSCSDIPEIEKNNFKGDCFQEQKNLEQKLSSQCGY